MLAFAVVILLANLVVLAVRTVSVVRFGSFDETTGTERVPIYAVWKARHGFPVYENPFVDNLYPALYNAGFYYIYGGVAKGLRWDGERLVTGCRLLTCVLAFGAAWISVGVLERLMPSPPTGRAKWWLWCATLATWLSSAGVSWFSVTVRPDILALLFAVAGLRVVVADGSRWPKFLAAGALFFAAWACKQSTVGIFAGVCGYTLFAPGARESGSVRYRAAILRVVSLVAPFLAGVALMMRLGGSTYRLNVIALPALSPGFTAPGFALGEVARVFAPNPIVWMTLLLALFRRLAPRGAMTGMRRSGSENPLSDRSHPVPLLTSIAVASGIVCVAALMRIGGSRNSLVEAHVALSLLAIQLLPGVIADPASRVARRLLILAAAVTIAYPCAQLAVPNRLGTVVVSSAERFAEGQAIAARLQSVPKPLFAEDYLFAEPWFSTDNRYPTVVMDNIIYLQARAAGRFPEGGIEALIRGRRFRALLLTGALHLEDVAQASGYQPAVLADSPHWNLRLYVLPN